MKKTILYILLDLVFLAVFNAVFFILGGTEHPLSVWISYGFIHFAYLMVVATPILCGRSGKNTILRMPIYTISTVYFFGAFVVGVLFILIRPESVRVPLLAQIVIAGAYAAVLLINLIANQDTAEQLRRQEEEVAYIKNSAARVKELMGRTGDKKAEKALEKAYDALRSSPTKSCEAVLSLEVSIADQISYLESAVKVADLASVIKISGDVVELAVERSRQLKKSN